MSIMWLSTVSLIPVCSARASRKILLIWGTDKAEARDDFARLVQALARVGLQIEVRNGDNCSLLVFVKPSSNKVLNRHVYRSRSVDQRICLQVDRSPLAGFGIGSTESEQLNLIERLILP